MNTPGINLRCPKCKMITALPTVPFNLPKAEVTCTSCNFKGIGHDFRYVPPKVEGNKKPPGEVKPRG